MRGSFRLQSKIGLLLNGKRILLEISWFILVTRRATDSTALKQRARGLIVTTKIKTDVDKSKVLLICACQWLFSCGVSGWYLVDSFCVHNQTTSLVDNWRTLIAEHTSVSFPLSINYLILFSCYSIHLLRKKCFASQRTICMQLKRMKNYAVLC